MNDISPVEVWNPYQDLLFTYNNTNYVVLVLNAPLNFSLNPQFLVNIWNNAKVKVTVDGGTEKWLNWITVNNLDFDQISLPDLITGDMDSLSQDVINFFNNGRTKIIQTPDQDETDFTKALRQLKKHCKEQNIEVETVYVLADTSGRFDQIMANINTLFKASNILPNVKIFQIASCNITWLLKTGTHSIHIPSVLRENREWCALVPIGSPCRVTTSGLKWNLDKGKLEFGGMVSTSNTYDGGPNVTIQTDGAVIWSMGINGLV